MFFWLSSAEALFLHGKRPAKNGSQGFEQLHLFRRKKVPELVTFNLRLAAGNFGFTPRRGSAGYVRKGLTWAWQEVELSLSPTSCHAQFAA